MKLLVVIPARAGSKRAPKKNLRMLGGKPLIQWTIETARSLDNICDVLITSNDTSVLNFCEKFKKIILCHRPEIISNDEAKMIDVLRHAADWYTNQYQKIDGVVLLQPTSPFRETNIVNKAINLFIKSYPSSVMSVTKTRENPLWTMKLTRGKLQQKIMLSDFDKYMQDFDRTYLLNGSLYIVSSKQLKKRTLYSKQIFPIIINSPKQSVDIDTEEDFQLAELFVKVKI